MTQNKKQTMVEINSTLTEVLTAHMAGKPILREMADRIESRRTNAVDSLIAEHVSEGDTLADLVDDLEFESDQE